MGDAKPALLLPTPSFACLVLHRCITDLRSGEHAAHTGRTSNRRRSLYESLKLGAGSSSVARLGARAKEYGGMDKALVALSKSWIPCWLADENLPGTYGLGGRGLSER